MDQPYPTKTRLALLDAIGGDNVLRHDGDYYETHPGGGPDRKVTARCTELIDAGWAVVDSKRGGMFRAVRPTERGYSILAEHFEQWREE